MKIQRETIIQRMIHTGRGEKNDEITLVNTFVSSIQTSTDADRSSQTHAAKHFVLRTKDKKLNSTKYSDN